MFATLVGVPLLLATANLLTEPVMGQPKNGNRDLLGTAFTLDPQTVNRGAEIYAKVCSACHGGGIDRAPARGMLALMTPESIRAALTTGMMRSQAAGLTADDRLVVSEYLVGRPVKDRIPATLMCKPGTSPFESREPPVFAGWGMTPENSHHIATQIAGLDRGNIGRLRLKWSLAFPNAIRARSQPALAGGAIVVGSHDGTVFSLDGAFYSHLVQVVDFT